jgi:hypothetical protein
MMKTRKPVPPLYRFILSLLTGLAFFAGCGGEEIKSHWRSREVAIDGRNTGWFAPAVSVNDELTSVVAFNDGEFLYVGLRTANRDLQRLILRQGITWWFDREGGDDKKFGFRYPVGGKMSPGNWSGENDVSEGEGERDLQQLNSTELDLYAAGDREPQRMTKMGTGGIDARFHRSRDTLYYEIQVPLSESGVHPFAIGALPGGKIGVGLETVHGRPQEGPSGESMERGGGSEGGRGMGGRGGGGGRGRGAGRTPRPDGGSTPSPIKVWARVQLAVQG